MYRTVESAYRTLIERLVLLQAQALQASAPIQPGDWSDWSVMLWIVIPIAFILFALFGALLIKFVALDLPHMSECFRRRKRSPETEMVCVTRCVRSRKTIHSTDGNRLTLGATKIQQKCGEKPAA